jgi:hypothetical protein
VDDRASASRHHVGEHGLAQAERGDQVELDGAADVVERLVLGRTGLGERAGGVDQDLGAADALGHRRDEGLQGVGVEQVAGDGDAADLVCEGVQPLPAAGGHGHRGALRRQGPGQCGAEPGRAAGHERHPPPEVERPGRGVPHGPEDRTPVVGLQAATNIDVTALAVRCVAGTGVRDAG